jgi:hypothetical protein
MLILFCVYLTGCATSKPPIAIKGKDYDDWKDHPGGICYSNEYAKIYLKWKNNK